MTIRKPITDVFAAIVPEELGTPSQDDPELIKTLDELAHAYVWRQWREVPAAFRPKIDFAVSEWLITSDPAAIESFQPAHDCAACRAGNDQARAFLVDHPNRHIALANLHYVEVYRDEKHFGAATS